MWREAASCCRWRLRLKIATWSCLELKASRGGSAVEEKRFADGLKSLEAWIRRVFWGLGSRLSAGNGESIC